MAIDQETAAKVLEADLGNIMRKVKAQKPLSNAEAKRITESAAKAPPAPEKSAPQHLPTTMPGKWPTFDSMKSCAGTTGISMAVLQQAAKEGCPAFRSNRVYFADLLPWILRANSGGVDWGAELEKFQAENERLEFEERVGTLVPFEEALSIARESLLPIRQAFIGLPAEMCAKCNPVDHEFARTALESWRDQKMGILAEAEREKIRRIKK